MREAYRWLGHPNGTASVASIYDAFAAAAGENDLPVDFFELAGELLRSDGSKPRRRARRGAVHASDRERAVLPTPLIQSKQSPTPQSSCGATRRPVARAGDVSHHRPAPRRERDMANAPVAAPAAVREAPPRERRNASRRHLSDTGSDHVDGRPDIGKKDRLLRRLIDGEPRFDLYRSRS